MTDLGRARSPSKEALDIAEKYFMREGIVTKHAREIDALVAAARREGAEAERAAMMEPYVLAQNHQYEAGRQLGQIEMREQAAQVALKHEAPTTARAILDLPLTPEEPT